MKNFIIFLVIITSFSANFLLAQNTSVLPMVEALERSYTNERRYNEVCFLTAHNAYSSSDEGWRGYVQQSLSLADQFAYGVRSFMIDLYWYQPDPNHEPYIALCHQSASPPRNAERSSANENCALTQALRWDATPQRAFDFFWQVERWLAADPDVIITVHLESYLGPFEAEQFNFWDVLTETNVDHYVYLPCTQSSPQITHLWQVTGPKEWPTLGKLRQDNKRLILFSNNVGLGKGKNVGDNVISTLAYRETAFNLKEFPGSEMRTDRRALPRAHLNSSEYYLLRNLLVMNHFYQYSQPGHYGVINRCEDILRRVNLCYRQENRLPNFIAVDFVEEGLDGGALEAVLLLNSRPPKDFHQFNGDVIPRRPFSSLSWYDWGIHTTKNNLGILAGTASATGALGACCLLCNHCLRDKIRAYRASIRPHND